MAHHPAGDPQAELGVGGPQQVHGPPPLFRVPIPAVALGLIEFVEDTLEPLVLQVVTHALGDGADQPDLLLEEGALVGLRRVFRIAHVDASHRDIVFHEVRPDDPGRLDETVGGVCRVTHDDADRAQ